MGYTMGYTKRNETDMTEIDLGDGLRIPSPFTSTVEQSDDFHWDEARESVVSIAAVWNAELYSYEITRLSVQFGPITGTLLRALPVNQILKVCVDQVLDAWPGWTARPDHEGRSNGPTPETLARVSLAYRIARVKMLPPTQHVSETFDIPHRTASHWVRLSRTRGYLAVD